MERNLRKTRIGKVVSDKMDKTIVVAVQDNVKHPLYKKIVNSVKLSYYRNNMVSIECLLIDPLCLTSIIIFIK